MLLCFFKWPWCFTLPPAPRLLRRDSSIWKKCLTVFEPTDHRRQNAHDVWSCRKNTSLASLLWLFKLTSWIQPTIKKEAMFPIKETLSSLSSYFVASLPFISSMAASAASSKVSAARRASKQPGKSAPRIYRKWKLSSWKWKLHIKATWKISSKKLQKMKVVLWKQAAPPGVNFQKVKGFMWEQALESESLLTNPNSNKNDEIFAYHHSPSSRSPQLSPRDNKLDQLRLSQPAGTSSVPELDPRICIKLAQLARLHPLHNCHRFNNYLWNFLQYYLHINAVLIITRRLMSPVNTTALCPFPGSILCRRPPPNTPWTLSLPAFKYLCCYIRCDV